MAGVPNEVGGLNGTGFYEVPEGTVWKCPKGRYGSARMRCAQRDGKNPTHVSRNTLVCVREEGSLILPCSHHINDETPNICTKWW